jgi:hypothetical protein
MDTSILQNNNRHTYINTTPVLINYNTMTNADNINTQITHTHSSVSSNTSSCNECIVCFDKIDDAFICLSDQSNADTGSLNNSNMHNNTDTDNTDVQVIDILHDEDHINNINNENKISIIPSFNKSTKEDNIKSLLYYNLKYQSCNCNYDIHFECLVYWLINYKYCPICRKKVNVNNNEANSITIKPIHGNVVNIILGFKEIKLDMNKCEYFNYSTIDIQQNQVNRQQVRILSEEERNQLLLIELERRQRNYRDSKIAVIVFSFLLIVLCIVMYFTTYS